MRDGIECAAQVGNKSVWETNTSFNRLHEKEKSLFEAKKLDSIDFLDTFSQMYIENGVPTDQVQAKGRGIKDG